MHSFKGAYNALIKAEEESLKVKALQRSLEDRRAALEALSRLATTEVDGRSVADEEFKQLIKLMSERIKDLQDEIRQLNRMVVSYRLVYSISEEVEITNLKNFPDMRR